MRYRVIPASELSTDLINHWVEIQDSNSIFQSPYFCPEFTLAVAAVRNDVRITIIQKGTEIIGFFPFHLSRGGIARPIGLGLSDYHGAIIGNDEVWCIEELMKECKLIRWEFDHLLASQRELSHFHENISESPIIDTSKGFEGFWEALDKSGRKQFKEAERKRKKMEEEVGSIRFNLHTQEKVVLDHLMKWKSLQCQRTGTIDFFSFPWCVQLVEKIHSMQKANFGGILSCLYAGDSLAAVHFLMYSRGVWHSWYPTYNDELQQYSPGLILLYEIIRSATEKELEYIDLGKGTSLYKKRVMSGGIPVAEGCIEVPSFRNQIRNYRDKIEEWSRNSFLKPVLRIPGQIIKAKERQQRYE